MKRHELKKGLILITYGILLTMVILKWDFFSGVFQSVSSLAAPFVYGLVLAFLVNGPYEFFRRRVLKRLALKKEGKYERAAKGLAVASAYLVIFICITAIIWFIIPQLVVSVTQLGQNISGYLDTAEESLTGFIESMGLSGEVKKQVDGVWSQLGQQITAIAGQVAPKLIDWTLSLTTGVFNWIIGLVVSIYMLYSKEVLIGQLKKLIRAIMPPKAADKTLEIGTLSNGVFGRYILGRIYDSVIVLVLCFLCMTVMQMPYALLISVIVGVTNVIPVFGPFLGGIPSALIVLMVDPMKGLWFIIFIIVLQQIDGNVICPRIVGDSMGISGIWVLAGVTLGGGLGGVMGMVVGVPILAVLYLLLGEFVNKRLKIREAKEQALSQATASAAGNAPGPANAERRPEAEAVESGKTDLSGGKGDE